MNFMQMSEKQCLRGGQNKTLVSKQKQQRFGAEFKEDLNITACRKQTDSNIVFDIDSFKRNVLEYGHIVKHCSSTNYYLHCN